MGDAFAEIVGTQIGYGNTVEDWDWGVAAIFALETGKASRGSPEPQKYRRILKYAGFPNRPPRALVRNGQGDLGVCSRVELAHIVTVQKIDAAPGHQVWVRRTACFIAQKGHPSRTTVQVALFSWA